MRSEEDGMKEISPMMAECMVTHGRGLDDFVRMEILKKISNASNVRHLSEGKIAFEVSWAGSNAKIDTLHKQDLKTNTIKQEDVCDSLQDTDTKGTQREEDATPNRISREKESHWVGAVCDIFKLRLVERAFILLHCENIDPKATHQNGFGRLDADAILTDYENKLHTLIGSIQWDTLAVRMRSMRKYQNGESQAWCQDPHSCPGSLKKRQARKEIGEKRMALAASRGMIKGCVKPHSRNTNTVQESETQDQGNKRRKFTHDCEVKLCLNSDMCKDEEEEKKIKGIKVSNMEKIGVKSCECDRVYPKRKHLSEGDAKSFQVVMTLPEQKNGVISSKNYTSLLNGGCLSEGISNKNEAVIEAQSELKPSTNKINVISVSHESPISSPEHRSKKVRRKEEDSNINSNKHTTISKIGSEDRDSNINSNKHTTISKVESEDNDSNINSSEETPTFRVSSRVSGPFKNLLTVKWINHVLSQQLRAVTSWIPDWRHPLIDLYVNITASHFIVGAALTPRPLSLRPYIPHLTLRSTISHLMATLSHMPPEATVLDPMCGGGSILLETAVNFDVSHVIASDISGEQLEVAKCNLRNLQVPVTLLQADAQGLPLQDSSINTVLCDFPFGQKYKLAMEDKDLLTRLLTEIQRLLVCGGVAVLLLSPKQHQSLSPQLCDNTKHSSTTVTAGNHLTLLESHLVSLGETSAYIAVITKAHPSIHMLKDK